MSYLAGVVASLKRGTVLLPELQQYAQRAAQEEATIKGERKRKVIADAAMTIGTLKRRIQEFNHGDDFERPLFHASALGICQRKLWLKHFKARVNKVTGDDLLRPYMIFELGTYLHMVIQNLCQKAGLLVQREVPILMEQELLIGHCDAVLKIEGVKYALEIKSINDNQFRDVSRKPKFEHQQQVTAYMKGLGIPWAIILYYNKNTSLFKEHVFAFDAEFYAEHVRKRIDTYYHALKARRAPKREGESASRFPCSYCEFSAVCWNDLAMKQFEGKLCAT